MTKLARFTAEVDSYNCPMMEPDSFGDWVKYDDVRAILESLKIQHATCEDALATEELVKDLEECVSQGCYFEIGPTDCALLSAYIRKLEATIEKLR